MHLLKLIRCHVSSAFVTIQRTSKVHTFITRTKLCTKKIIQCPFKYCVHLNNSFSNNINKFNYQTLCLPIRMKYKTGKFVSYSLQYSSIINI